MNAAWLPWVMASATLSEAPAGTGARPWETTAPCRETLSARGAGTSRETRSEWRTLATEAARMEPHTAVPRALAELDRRRLDATNHPGVVLGCVPDDGVGG
jgi:hypothetical protein